ncbi:hypothetical protein YC2023_019886 [Brassica napus]
MLQVCYIKYPRVRNRYDPWVTVTRLNPRGRVQGSSELEDPLQPSTSGNLSATEDLAGVGLVVDLTDFGEEVVVHVEDEPVIGEFHQDPDSDSSEKHLYLLMNGLMMIRPGLDSIVVVVVRGASLGIPAIFRILLRPTAPTIHLPLLHPLLLLSLPLLHPLLLLRVLRVLRE